jgi:hypothetical protein
MIPEATINELKQLAELIACRNQLEKEISAIIGRPAALGHLGEYIASRVFPIKLVKSASHQAIDGFFYEGPLSACSVNVKWYAMREGILDITPGFLPDYYLVLVGPPPTATAALGLRTRPWKIFSVHLFDAAELVDDLELRGVRIGIASSVRKELWDAAEVYPYANSSRYSLCSQQCELLNMFNQI